MNGDTLARRRFFTIQAVRIAGVFMILLGLLVVNGRIDWPPIVGYLLALNGLADFAVIPVWLARRWKTPNP